MDMLKKLQWVIRGEKDESIQNITVGYLRDTVRQMVEQQQEIERLRGELESRDTTLKDFAETIALFDSQADRCPECNVWRDAEMKEHKDSCTVNKIDEWLS
jgi:hypothetical protein